MSMDMMALPSMDEKSFEYKKLICIKVALELDEARKTHVMSQTGFNSPTNHSTPGG